jgi:hypothetical protein
MPTRHVREFVWEPPSPQYLLERARRGWRLVALEWEREMTDEEARTIGLPADVPYGLRVASSSLTLEEDPDERAALVEILGLIVKEDVRFSAIAQALNAKGSRTRGGGEWTPSAVFDLLPRLVEVAPTILSTDEWEALKARL